MTLQNQSLDAAERALAKIVKGRAAQQHSPLRKSIDSLRERFGIPGDESPSERIKAARARSKNVEQRAPAPEEDSPPSEKDAPMFGYGPEFVPLAWRVQGARMGEMLQGVKEAHDEIKAREEELSLDGIGNVGAGSTNRMRTAQQRQPRSRPTPGSRR